MDHYLDTIEEVASIGYGGYDWSVLNVYKAEDGNYYWLEASGCSCSSIDDYADNISDLTPLNGHTWNEFETAVVGFDSNYATGEEKVGLLRKVSALIPRGT